MRYTTIFLFLLLILYVVIVEFSSRGCDSYYLTGKEQKNLSYKANNGDLKAIEALVSFHLINCNGNRDEVLKWLKEAVKYGSAKEYYNLGNYLVSFHDDNKTLYNEGILWLTKSASLGYMDAKNKLENLTRKH